MKQVLAFLRDAKTELLRVNWPTRKEVLRYTEIVVAISFAVAVFLGVLDFSFSWLVENVVFRAL